MSCSTSLATRSTTPTTTAITLESEVDNAVAAAVAPKADSADVYTKGEVDTALADKADSADVYTKAESDQYRVADIEIMGSVASTGNKSSSGPFTSSRGSTGVYFVNLSDLAPLGLPFKSPLMIVSPVSGCNGGTAIGSWSSIGATNSILTDASMRVEIYDSAGVADDCGFQFSIRFQQPDDFLADLLTVTTRARTQSTGNATQRCTNDDSGVVCVDL